VGHSARGGFQLVVKAPICYKIALLMKHVAQLLFLLPLLLTGGCAQWSPFVKNSKLHKVCGYPPRKLGEMLQIPATDRLRVEDYSDQLQQ
jgi:hypothetical protein